MGGPAYARVGFPEDGSLEDNIVAGSHVEHDHWVFGQTRGETCEPSSEHAVKTETRRFRGTCFAARRIPNYDGNLPGVIFVCLGSEARPLGGK